MKESTKFALLGGLLILEVWLAYLHSLVDRSSGAVIPIWVACIVITIFFGMTVIIVQTDE